MKDFRKSIALLLSILCFFSIQELKGDIALKFLGKGTAEFYYPVTVKETVKATAGGSSSTLTPTSNKLWIPKGTTEVSISFDKPEAVTAIDLGWSTRLASTNMITNVEIENLPYLESLVLSNNSLTWPITAGIPDNCSVTYGQQQTVIFPVLRDNFVDLCDYNFTGWSSKWVYAANGQPVDASYFTTAANGMTRFNQNLTNTVKVYLSHTSGFELESQPMRFNKIVSPLLSFTTDGRGTATSLSFQSNQVANQPMVAECKEDYVENDAWKITLNVPSILNKTEEVTVSVNIPEVISAIYLNNLGIDRLVFPTGLPYLSEIELQGNSLLPSAIPSAVFGCKTVKIGQQLPFTLQSSGNNQFDLSKEIDAGANIKWLDDNGQSVANDCYTVSNGIYTFVKSIGAVTALLTLASLPDYSITSEPVEIESNYSTVSEFAWASEYSIPPTISISASADTRVLLNADAFNVGASQTSSIRLGATSGNALLKADNPEGITFLDFSYIGINSLQLSGNLKALISLNVSGNNFSPFNLPQNIPTSCKVIWGEMKTVDISALVNTATNSVDLYDYSDFDISWHLYPSGEEVEPDVYTELSGYYTFENVGNVYAVITIPGYEGLEFKTNVVNLSSNFYNILTFNSKGSPKGNFTLTGETRFEINGKENHGPFKDEATLDFTNGTTTIADYTVSSNFPQNITEIDLSASGITSIELESNLTNLESLDLSGNAMTFKTFPSLNGVSINLDNQEPVNLEFDHEKGEVRFPEFADCKEISVVDSNGYTVDTSLYEIEDANDALTFKASVNNVAIKFAGHPLFPGVYILSKPMNFVAQSSLTDIGDDAQDLVINGCTIAAPTGNDTIIYDSAGRKVAVIKGGTSKSLQPGFYIAVVGLRALKVRL